MVRQFTGVGVVVTSSDINRLATRVQSLSANLARFEGLVCRSCVIDRDQEFGFISAVMHFEVPLNRRVWVDPKEVNRVYHGAARWLGRWVENPDLGEFSNMEQFQH